MRDFHKYLPTNIKYETEKHQAEQVLRNMIPDLSLEELNEFVGLALNGGPTDWKYFSGRGSEHNMKKVTHGPYTCTKCGMEAEIVTLSHSDPRYRTMDWQECEMRLLTIAHAPTGRVRILRPFPSFGVLAGEIVDLIPCPNSEVHRYAHSAWIHSPKRGEPMRLLDGEYQKIEE